jgi:hypothetical protein
MFIYFFTLISEPICLILSHTHSNDSSFVTRMPRVLRIRENGSQGVIPYLAFIRKIYGSTTNKSSLQCSKDPRGRAGFMPRVSVGSV